MDRRRFLKLSGLALGSVAAAPLLGKLGGPGSAAAAAPGKRTVAVALDHDLPVHPALQYGAAAEPDKKVRVIVQKTTKGADGRAIAAQHGATHLEEFSFIKAHHMELPQKAVMRMGLHKDVLWIGPDSPAQKHAGGTINYRNLKTTYPVNIEATRVWDSGVTGRGVTVAVLDTGINNTRDWQDQTIVHAVNVNKTSTTAADGHGHGTHVASMINGMDGSNNYIGTAPHANVINVKIADDTGMAHEADMLRGLQWCYDNRAGYGGIRVVNLSICAGTAESYKTSPVCAAVEQLWLNGVVVVVAAGNRGNATDATWYAPANDPYVITVGALDENASTTYHDFKLATFSSRGKTQDGFYKPEVVAPGRKIYGALASTTCTLAQQMPTHVADGHLRLSGTSMAAPQVAGTCALLLQQYPNLTPNQLKALVISSGNTFGSPANPMVDNAKLVDPFYAKVNASTTPLPVANQGLTPNKGIDPANGNTVAWTSAYWDSAYWDSAYWDSAYWDVSTTVD